VFISSLLGNDRAGTQRNIFRIHTHSEPTQTLACVGSDAQSWDSLFPLDSQRGGLFGSVAGNAGIPIFDRLTAFG
jgi:hypothetical protein